jgi:hypothetical protein
VHIVLAGHIDVPGQSNVGQKPRCFWSVSKENPSGPSWRRVN